MAKVAVVYWSGTSNTEKMTGAVAEGAKAAGAEVDLFEVDSFSVDQIDDATARSTRRAPSGSATEMRTSIPLKPTNGNGASIVLQVWRIPLITAFLRSIDCFGISVG